MRFVCDRKKTPPRGVDTRRSGEVTSRLAATGSFPVIAASWSRPASSGTRAAPLHCLFEGRRMTETDNNHFRFLAQKLRENLFALVGRSLDGTQMIDLMHVKAYRSARGAKGEK
jgi:hypothetical protein